MVERRSLDRLYSSRALRSIALVTLLAASTSYVSKKDPIFIINERALAGFIRQDPALAETLFDSPSTIVIDTPHASLPEDWHVTYALSFASYEDFAASVIQGIAPKIDAVVYDNEKWAETPVEEQINPVVFTKKFAELAHANKLLFINVPHPGLAQAQGHEIKGLSQNWNFYLGLLKKVAKYSDILVVQIQQAVHDGEEYNERLIQAREIVEEEAGKLGRNISFLGEISTNPGIAGANAENLLAIVD